MATMDNERGSRCLRYELESYVTSIHDDDTRFAVRRNGKLFHILVSPAEFLNSPATTKKYLLYLELLRSGAEVLGDVYDTDVYEWVTRPFEGLFAELAPRPVLPEGHANITVTLEEHLFPSFFLLALDVVDEMLQPRRIESKASPYFPPQVLLDDDFLDDLEKWTTLHDPTRIVLSSDNSDDALFKPPGKVLIDHRRTACFFKPCFSGVQTKTELQAYQKIASANLDARLSVDPDHPSTSTKTRWMDQLEADLSELHKAGIVWGDVKAKNVLVDRQDNVWITDFGGGYTNGWD